MGLPCCISVFTPLEKYRPALRARKSKPWHLSHRRRDRSGGRGLGLKGTAAKVRTQVYVRVFACACTEGVHRHVQVFSVYMLGYKCAHTRVQGR